MAGTESYHSVPQGARIQKRLVLNQCFKAIGEIVGRLDSLVYVTFGGAELFDVMDLVAVFDVRRHKLAIISYEQDISIAEASQRCPVASTLSRIETVRVVIVPSTFFDQAAPLQELRHTGRFIYFLDDTRPFSTLQANKLGELLRAGFLHAGDFLLITSCITPRIMHQSKFMADQLETFKLFYGPACNPDRDFKVRNHVDLLLALTLSKHDRVVNLSAGTLLPLRARLLRKFKYRDTRAAMGLWLYEIGSASLRAVRLVDKEFEEFPLAFVHRPEPSEGIPDIFDSIE